MVGDCSLLWRVLEEKVKKMEPHRIIAYFELLSLCGLPVFFVTGDSAVFCDWVARLCFLLSLLFWGTGGFAPL